MRLRHTPRAIADLTEIADYLASFSPMGAERVRTAVLATPRIVVDLPHAGRLQTADAVRKTAVRRYFYLVFYRIDDDAGEILILAI